jgi:hypothetical protein
MKQKIPIWILVILFTLTVSCQSIEYRSKVLIDNKSRSVKYKTSYGTGDHFWLCAGTWMLAGGWCWNYLFMPTDHHKNLAKWEIKQKILQKYPNKKVYFSSKESIRRGTNNFVTTTLSLKKTKKDKYKYEKGSSFNPEKHRQFKDFFLGAGLVAWVPMLAVPGLPGIALFALWPLWAVPGLGLMITSFISDEHAPDQIKMQKKP